ncbi:MAG TPA: hypothetical protein VGK02_07540 [Candidatus Aquicultor sp.]|jgi:hypothetical protein
MLSLWFEINTGAGFTTGFGVGLGFGSGFGLGAGGFGTGIVVGVVVGVVDGVAGAKINVGVCESSANVFVGIVSAETGIAKEMMYATKKSAAIRMRVVRELYFRAVKVNPHRSQNYVKTPVTILKKRSKSKAFVAFLCLASKFFYKEKPELLLRLF